MERRSIVEKRGTHRGYPYAVLFQKLGFRCGYVGIPKTDRYYGCDESEVPVCCHGGLTYADSFLAGVDDSNDIWWIGFDCAHWNDKEDYTAMLKYFPDDDDVKRIVQVHMSIESKFPNDGAAVKDLQFVENECISIIDQLLDEDLESKGEEEMLFGNILIPLDDYDFAMQTLAEDCQLSEGRAYIVLNKILTAALENAKEDNT